MAHKFGPGVPSRRPFGFNVDLTQGRSSNPTVHSKHDVRHGRNATTGEQPADIYRDPVSPSPPVARHHNEPFVRHVETVGVHPVTGKYVDPTHPNAERRPRAMRYIRMCRCAPKD